MILSTMSRQDSTSTLSAAARNSASSTNSLHPLSPLFKRDSAASLGHAGSRSDARRISLRRSFQSSEAAFVEDDLAQFLADQPAIMGPVYRLVSLRFSFLSSSHDSSTLHLPAHRRRLGIMARYRHQWLDRGGSVDTNAHDWRHPTATSSLIGDADRPRRESPRLRARHVRRPVGPGFGCSHPTAKQSAHLAAIIWLLPTDAAISRGQIFRPCPCTLDVRPICHTFTATPLSLLSSFKTLTFPLLSIRIRPPAAVVRSAPPQTPSALALHPVCRNKASQIAPN